MQFLHPSFLDSPCFDKNKGNWKLKDGASEKIKREFFVWKMSYEGYFGEDMKNVAILLFNKYNDKIEENK